MNKYLLERIVVGPIETNCYLLADAASRQALIIDPGEAPERIIKRLEYKTLKPIAIVNTHGHVDHIMANQALKTVYKIPIYIHENDNEFLTDPALNYSQYVGGGLTLPPADIKLKEGDIIDVGGLTVQVYHTPGHTPGGICLLCEDLLFTGDTLFCGSIGRTDLPGGDDETLTNSLKLFSKLPKELKVYPGHGPESTIAQELKHNPYL